MANRKIVLNLTDSIERVYEFLDSEEGMIIKIDNVEIGRYQGFELGDNLDDNYLLELVSEF